MSEHAISSYSGVTIVTMFLDIITILLNPKEVAAKILAILKLLVK